MRSTIMKSAAVAAILVLGGCEAADLMWQDLVQGGDSIPNTVPDPVTGERDGRDD